MRLYVQLAMIGLGRMGGNMAERLMRRGHKLVAFDRTPDVVAKYEKLGATSASDLATVVRSLRAPRIIWIMVPAGDPVDRDDRRRYRPMLSPGDIIIDGGNSNFHDTIRRGDELAQSKIELDRLRARAAASGDSRTATVSWSAAATPP